MCRALVTIVFTTAFFAGSAFTPAHTAPASLPAVSVTELKVQPSPERISSNAAFRPTTAQTPAATQVVALTYQGADHIAPIPVAVHPAASHAGKDDSGWRYTTGLLSTLALIGTIALRRHKAGKPWL